MVGGRGRARPAGITARPLVWGSLCASRHNSSSSSMWPWSRASISAWLMGGDCIRVWLLVFARIARTGSTVLYVLDRSAQKGDVAHERFGRHAGEFPEIPDEMRLVDVSAAGRQVGPPNRGTSIFRLPGLDIRFADSLVGSRAAQPVQRAHDPIEAQQSRERLGWETHARLKSRNQRAVAAIHFGGE